MSKEKTRWWFRKYANDDADLERMKSLGIDPVRMLTNEGQVAIMAGDPDDPKRVALVDCQTKFKRGEGYKTECAERDVTAALIAAAPEMLAALKLVQWGDHHNGVKVCPSCGHAHDGHHPGCVVAAAIAKAEGRAP